jgi:hypothetical protein
VLCLTANASFAHMYRVMNGHLPSPPISPSSCLNYQPKFCCSNFRRGIEPGCLAAGDDVMELEFVENENELERSSTLVHTLVLTVTQNNTHQQLESLSILFEGLVPVPHPPKLTVSLPFQGQRREILILDETIGHFDFERCKLRFGRESRSIDYSAGIHREKTDSSLSVVDCRVDQRKTRPTLQPLIQRNDKKL